MLGAWCVSGRLDGQRPVRLCPSPNGPLFTGGHATRARHGDRRAKARRIANWYVRAMSTAGARRRVVALSRRRPTHTGGTPRESAHRHPHRRRLHQGGHQDHDRPDQPVILVDHSPVDALLVGALMLLAVLVLEAHAEGSRRCRSGPVPAEPARQTSRGDGQVNTAAGGDTAAWGDTAARGDPLVDRRAPPVRTAGAMGRRCLAVRRSRPSRSRCRGHRRGRAPAA